MKLLKNNQIIILFYLFFCLILFFPALINPNLLLNRNNDLTEFFWPTLYYVKNSILSYHQLPLWNNFILSGTPLVADPQAPIFYPFNIIYLFLPIDTALFIAIFIHIFLSALAMHCLAKIWLKFSTTACLLSGTFYMLSPKVGGFLEAGHLGIIYCYPWIPIVLLSIVLIFKNKKFYYSYLLSIALAALFINHLITFLIVGTFAGMLGLFLLAGTLKSTTRIKIILLLLLGLVCFVGLISVALLPQIEWKDSTTRSILLQDRDVYPKWLGKREFFLSIFFPYIIQLSSLDTEKWVTPGISILIYSGIGFIFLKLKHKFFVALLLGVILLIGMNNLLPFYKKVLLIDVLVILRVATRFWILIPLVLSLLSAFAFEKLNKLNRFKKINILLVFFILIELIFLNWTRFYRPIIRSNNTVPIEIINFLKQDRSEVFRIFCLNRCISEKDAVSQNFELIDGYNTVFQIKYYQQMWQFTNKFWDYYTLSLPPFGIYEFEKLNPHTLSLGQYNTKYIIAPYELNNGNLELKLNTNGYYLYQNHDYLPRVYSKLQSQTNIENTVDLYTPNEIGVKVTSTDNNLVLANSFNSGWKAYANRKDQIPIQQTPSGLMSVDIPKYTNYILFKFFPDSLNTGILISVTTIILISLSSLVPFLKIKR